MKKNVLVVDANNIFIKNWIKNPMRAASDDRRIGAIVGFLRAIEKTFRLFEPEEIIICWDGYQCNNKKKEKYEGYKANRSNINFKIDGVEWEEESIREDRYRQQGELLEYLNTLPVIQLLERGYEADELISYVCQSEFLSEHKKVILSTDKDFYQILKEDVMMYDISSGKYTTSIQVEMKHSITTDNFLVARAMAGDSSDNIKGIGRVGLKTAAKRYPILKEHKKITPMDLVAYAQKQIKLGNKVKAYTNLLDNEALFHRNVDLMNLQKLEVSEDISQTIDSLLKEPQITKSFEIGTFMKKCAADGTVFLLEDLKNKMLLLASKKSNLSER